jgi:hypothetical protein
MTIKFQKASSVTLLLFLSVLFVTIVTADFHIVQGIAPGGGSGIEACPSNYYNCACLKNGDRAAKVTDGSTKGIGTLKGRTYFKVKKSLCGMGDLDFYKQGDGSWKFYVSGGNGDLQGTCYANNAGTSCSPGFFFYDQLVCYSYICNA